MNQIKGILVALGIVLALVAVYPFAIVGRLLTAPVYALGDSSDILVRLMVGSGHGRKNLSEARAEER